MCTRLGWLPPWVLETIGAHLRVPKSEVFGIASSFPDLRLTEPPEHVARLCIGASCRMRRSGAFEFDGEVAEADCLFICGVGPAAEIDGHLRSLRSTDSTRELAATALRQDGACSRSVTALVGGRPLGARGTAGSGLERGWRAVVAQLGWHTVAPARRIRLLHDVGRLDPLAGRPNGYAALQRALEMGSARVWGLVKESGLRGRGGASSRSAPNGRPRGTPRRPKSICWSTPRRASPVSTRIATCWRVTRTASSKASRSRRWASAQPAL